MHLVEIIAQTHLKHRKYPKQNDLKAYLFILYIQILNNRKKTLKLIGDIWIKSYLLNSQWSISRPQNAQSAGCL